MDSLFRFRHFSLNNSVSAQKIGTDSVVLGSSMTLDGSERLLLDIGTGTGVLAVMAAWRLHSLAGDSCVPVGEGRDTDFRIDAVEIDAASAREASLNFASSDFSSSLRCYHTDLKDFRPDAPYDMIFCNPPYYDSSLPNPDSRKCGARHTSSLPHEVLCSFVASHLGESGRFSLILPSDSRLRFIRTAASFGLYPTRILSVRTLASKPVSRAVMEFSLRKTLPVPEEELTLNRPDGSRTFEYSSLVGDFLLPCKTKK